MFCSIITIKKTPARAQGFIYSDVGGTIFFLRKKIVLPQKTTTPVGNSEKGGKKQKDKNALPTYQTSIRFCFRLCSV